MSETKVLTHESKVKGEWTAGGGLRVGTAARALVLTAGAALAVYALLLARGELQRASRLDRITLQMQDTDVLLRRMRRAGQDLQRDVTRHELGRLQEGQRGPSLEHDRRADTKALDVLSMAQQHASSSVMLMAS